VRGRAGKRAKWERGRQLGCRCSSNEVEARGGEDVGWRSGSGALMVLAPSAAHERARGREQLREKRGGTDRWALALEREMGKKEGAASWAEQAERGRGGKDFPSYFSTNF